MKMKKNKIFLILLSLLITACTNLTPDPQTASPAPEFGSALDLEVKKELLEIPLINDKNEKLNLNSFKGKTIVITPIFTSCDDICPLSAANFRVAQEAIQAVKLDEKISLLLISIDPDKDSPERLAAYRKKLDLTDQVFLLTGTNEDINKFWDGFGIAREIKQATEGSENEHSEHKDWFTGEESSTEIVHSDGLFFISSDQKLKFLRLGLPDVSKIQVNTGTKELLNDEVTNSLTKPVPGGWQASDVVRILSWMLKTPIYIV